MVTLLSDAGVYRKGATFRTLDWAISAYRDAWPNRSMWRWEGQSTHTVKIVAGIPVREDGAILHTWKSGYKWCKKD